LALKKRVNTKASEDSGRESCWRIIPQQQLASEQSEVVFPIKIRWQQNSVLLHNLA
jgi:hypothetical protein